MDINKWWADRCGVEFILNRDGWFIYPINHAISEDCEAIKWIVKDPRCREIVRERFKIATTYSYIFENWRCVVSVEDGEDYEVEGKTIAEAEIACLTAIYKENNDE